MTTDSALSGKQRLARGLAASPGIATGQIVFRSDDARVKADAGVPVILVRIETSAEDVEGMRAAQGILTTRGGLTGDAAIVARILGKACVAGCTAAHVDYVQKTVTFSVEDEQRATRERVVVREGELLTIDGGSGFVYAG